MPYRITRTAAAARAGTAGEPRRTHGYRVHPIADLARRDVIFEEVARAAMRYG